MLWKALMGDLLRHHIQARIPPRLSSASARTPSGIFTLAVTESDESALNWRQNTSGPLPFSLNPRAMDQRCFVSNSKKLPPSLLLPM